MAEKSAVSLGSGERQAGAAPYLVVDIEILLERVPARLNGAIVGNEDGIVEAVQILSIGRRNVRHGGHKDSDERGQLF